MSAAQASNFEPSQNNNFLPNQLQTPKVNLDLELRHVEPDETNLPASIKIPLNDVESALPSTRVADLPNPEQSLSKLPLAEWHLENYPFITPENVDEKILWYEGSFDPTGPHHMDVWEGAWNLGFEKGVFAICHQNPLKPDSTSFEERVKMAELWLVEKGFKLAENMGDPGVYIEKDPELFQHRKIVNFYSNNVNLLMGPDNFERYYAENVPWSHVNEIRGNRGGLSDFGFQRMYNEIPGFAQRILVYPRVHHIHSTDLRNHQGGEFQHLIPQSVTDFISQQDLYPSPTNNKRIKTKSPSQSEETIASNKTKSKPAICSASMCESISKTVSSHLEKILHSNAIPATELSLERTLRNLDLSSLIKINNTLNQTNNTSSRRMYSPGSEPFSKLTDSVLETLVRDNARVHGTNMLLELLDQGKKLIFVSNNRGPLEKALVAYTLRNQGLSELSKQLVFASHESTRHCELEKEIVDNSVSTILLKSQKQPLTSDDMIKADSGKKAQRDNGQTLAKRLVRDQHIVLFPEEHYNNDGQHAGVSICSNDIAHLLRRSNFINQELDSESVVIVPMATFGADAAFKTPNSSSLWTTEDAPYLVRFGAGIDLKSFQDVLESGVLYPNGDAHLLGHMISELLPEQNRGAYSRENDSLPVSTAKQVEKALEVLTSLREFRITNGSASLAQ